MVTKIDITQFLELAQQHLVFDVRSPGEYSHAHIPEAHNLPLFSDEERKVVGTAYKQRSREDAIKIGLDYFGVKMRTMVEDVERIVKEKKDIPLNKHQKQTVLVHCWRGGMRSAGVAWLLDLYGYNVYTLQGGYKAFRNWVLAQFPAPLSYRIIGGYTGSGKTHLLHRLTKARQTIVDLEGLAHHKGSAFGGLGQPIQPSQEHFENKLALALSRVAEKCTPDTPIWVEDESRRIGHVKVPDALWLRMRKAPIYFLDIPQNVRLDLIMKDYGKFKKDDMVATVMRIRKRLGGLATKEAINHIVEDNYKEAFGILLNYYDKFYKHDLTTRDNLNEQLTTITADTTDPEELSRQILARLREEATPEAEKQN